MRTTLRNANPRLIYFTISAADCAAMLAKLSSMGMAAWYQPRTGFKATEHNGAISEVTLINTPEIHLPRWTDVRRAPAGTDKLWKRCVDILHRHEKGHHRDFSSNLAGLKRMFEARDILTRREYDRIVRESVAKHRRLSDRYHATDGSPREVWQLLRKGP